MQLSCQQPSELSFIFLLFPVYLSEKLFGSKMFFRHQFLNPRAFFLLMINSSHLSSHPKQKRVRCESHVDILCMFFRSMSPWHETPHKFTSFTNAITTATLRRLYGYYAPNLVFMRRWNLQIIQILFVPPAVHLTVFTFFHQRPRLTDTFWKDDTQRCSQSTNKRPTDHQ